MEGKLTVIVTLLNEMYVTKKSPKECLEEATEIGYIELKAPDAAVLQIGFDKEVISHTQHVEDPRALLESGKIVRRYRVMPFQAVIQSDWVTILAGHIMGIRECNELTEEHTLEKAYTDVAAKKEEADAYKELVPNPNTQGRPGSIIQPRMDMYGPRS